MRTKRMTCRAYVKSVDLPNRTVEQIVSVFGNVDLGKDRVAAGAFTGTLARWGASGDPIPTIWSHQWDNPDAHIGYVIEAKELLPGDPLLPTEIADLGGLYTKYQLDDRPFAEQVLHLLNTRRVKESSFAYDVIREKKNSDGTNDLLELDLIEVGPTLKGMNPATQLLAAGRKGRGTANDLDPKSVRRWIDAFEAEGRRQQRARAAGGFRCVNEAIAYGDPAAVRAALSRLEA